MDGSSGRLRDFRTGRETGGTLDEASRAGDEAAMAVLRNAPGLKTAQYGSISFDMSFHEIFATWLAGGLLVILPETSRRQADELLEILQRDGIQRIFIPFIGLQLLAEHPAPAEAFMVAELAPHALETSGTTVVVRYHAAFDDV